MPESSPRPVSGVACRVYTAAAALFAAALLATAAPLAVVGTDTAAACNVTGGSCGG